MKGYYADLNKILVLSVLVSATLLKLSSPGMSGLLVIVIVLITCLMFVVVNRIAKITLKSIAVPMSGEGDIKKFYLFLIVISVIAGIEFLLSISRNMILYEAYWLVLFVGLLAYSALSLFHTNAYAQKKSYSAKQRQKYIIIWTAILLFSLYEASSQINELFLLLTRQ